MSPATPTIPKKGLNKKTILSQMRSFRGEDANYTDGKTWSLVYYLGEAHTQFLKEAHNTYFSENGLNPMAFRSLKRFESEVVRMTADMLHGDSNVVGTMTSGGTESCLLAVKTYRDKARAERRFLGQPEMIVPESIHVAFEKAAEYFGVKAVHAPLDKNFQVDVKAVKKRINRNTILLVGSAPSYPHGMVDPITELGELALKKKLPLHVDSCLGGFMLPWVEKLGYDVPAFDFRVPGVTSITADVHKYGYAAKGASTILYRDKAYLKHQIFVYENWPGGIFASPALLGTRPGGSIAAAWAALMAMGESGYLEHAKITMDTTRKLMAGIAAMPEYKILGAPHMSVFAYDAVDPDINVFAVADQMEKKGWHIDRLQRPVGLHAMVTSNHAKIADDYLADLREATDHVRAHPELATQGGAATYGMIAAIPLRGMIRQNVLKMMLDFYGPGDQQLSLDEPEDDLATKAGMLYLDLKKKLERKLKG
jgi:sphinganine-1-phosphate aldolase